MQIIRNLKLTRRTMRVN